MDNIKYLPDGRKVVVIGKINKTEYIVQEVYIAADNSEIPSGDNFTASALLDQPAKSWKDKELEKSELRKSKLEQELGDLEREKSKLLSDRLATSLILKSNQKFIDLFKGHDTELLADILTGNVKYVISDGYSRSFEVQTFEEAMYSYDNHYGDKRFEGIRMLTVMGIKGSSYPSDQKMRMSISSYADGSGSNSSVSFYKDASSVKAELEKRMYAALKEIQDKDKVTRKSLSLSDIKLLQRWIDVPEHIVNMSKEDDLKHVEDYYQQKIKEAVEYKAKQLNELKA
jgi:hypothetical protein